MSSHSPELSDPTSTNPHYLPPGQLYPFVASVTTEELSLFAAFLARDMGFEGAAARGKAILWYRDQVGRDVCTVTQAAHLRQLTIQECEEPRTRKRLPAPDSLRDFARDDVKDDAEHRARRSRVLSFLPGRISAGISLGITPRQALGLPQDVEAAVEAEFDERARAAVTYKLEVSDNGRDWYEAGTERRDPRDIPVWAEALKWLFLGVLAGLALSELLWRTFGVFGVRP